MAMYIIVDVVSFFSRFVGVGMSGSRLRFLWEERNEMDGKSEWACGGRMGEDGDPAMRIAYGGRECCCHSTTSSWSLLLSFVPSLPARPGSLVADFPALPRLGWEGGLGEPPRRVESCCSRGAVNFCDFRISLVKIGVSFVSTTFLNFIRAASASFPRRHFFCLWGMMIDSTTTVGFTKKENIVDSLIPT
jgi:hypothetical protein